MFGTVDGQKWACRIPQKAGGLVSRCTDKGMGSPLYHLVCKVLLPAWRGDCDRKVRDNNVEVAPWLRVVEGLDTYSQFGLVSTLDNLCMDFMQRSRNPSTVTTTTNLTASTLVAAFPPMFDKQSSSSL